MTRDLLVVSAPVELGVRALHKIHELRLSVMLVVLAEKSLKKVFVADFVETIVVVDTSSYQKVVRAVPGLRRLGKFDGVFVLETGQQYLRLRLLGFLCRGRLYIMNENMGWFELRDISALFRHIRWRLGITPGRLALYLMQSLIAVMVVLRAFYWHVKLITNWFKKTLV
jgi:hypothetical protein